MAPYLTSLEQICEKQGQAVLWLVQNKEIIKVYFLMRRLTALSNNKIQSVGN
jgi:hypothetical protein